MQTALMEAFPKVTVQPKLLPVSVPSDQCQFIVFDLETTGIAVDSDICQIAAMKADHECAASKPAPAAWSTYLIPGRNIERRAHRVNGLSTDDHHGHRCLFRHGKPVEAQQYKEGIQSFYSYLQKQSSPGKHTILVAYGSERLDAPVLINSLNRCGISRQDLGGLIAGFSDALKMIRKMRTDPSMLKGGLPPTEFSLSSIYNHLFNTQLRDAHDAVTDTRALHRILFQSHLKISPAQLLSSSSTLASVHDMVQYSTTALSNLHTMKGKLFNNQDGPQLFLTRHMAAVIAKSGMCYEDLARVYREYGASGITYLLSGPCSGREVRVTSDKATIDAVIDHFQSSHDNLS
jgi:DNA polymerase III epsilon subunit-like protein